MIPASHPRPSPRYRLIVAAAAALFSSLPVRRIGVAACVLGVAIGSSRLSAATEATKTYSIPAGDAVTALRRFATQSGQQIVYSGSAVEGVKTSAVEGEFTARQALNRMLAGTDLIVTEDKQNGALAITRNDPNGRRAALALPNGRPQNDQTSDASSDTAVELSPFEVRADLDTGYQATSTLAGTRLRSDLKDVAASISVVTKDFMEDIAANDLEGLLTYTLGTEVAGPGGNFSNADIGGAGEGLNFNGALERIAIGTRVRGLTSADTTRGFFPSSIPVDGYNMERTEISRGPNSMLFGLGSPAGIINNSLLRASMRKNATKVKHQMGSYGSARYELDHEQTLIKDKLGVRFATMYDKTYYRIHPAYTEKKSSYLTAAYRPFRNTTIRLSGEVGQRDENRPQYRPPYDSTSYWWDVGQPVWDPVTATFTKLGAVRAADATVTPATTQALTTTVMGWAGNSNFALFYSDPNSSELGIPGTGAQAMKTLSERVYRNAANTGWVTSSGMRMLNNSNHYFNRLSFGEPSYSY